VRLRQIHVAVVMSRRLFLAVAASVRPSISKPARSDTQAAEDPVDSALGGVPGPASFA